MPVQLAFDLQAAMPDMVAALDRVEQFGAEQGWGEQSQFQLRLVLEEILINIVTHGVGSDGRPRIELSLQQNGEWLLLTVRDNAQAFNPLAQAEPDLTADLDERAVGGLGVHFIRQLVEQAQYHREDGWNSLSLRRRCSE